MYGKILKRFVKKVFPKPLGRLIVKKLLLLFPAQKNRLLDVGQNFYSGNPLCVKLNAGFNMELRLDDLIERRLYYTGRYEPLVEVLLRELVKNGCFVDIGANNGYYSLMAASILENKGRVYSFEPFPETFRRLYRNVQLNPSIRNIHMHQKAVSNKEGEVPLFLRGGQLGLVSMSSIGLSSDVAGVKVKCDKLDNILKDEMVKKIDLVKIDVEGAEVHVLQGMSGLLVNGKCPNVLIEMHPKQIRDLGFQPEEVGNLLELYGYKLIELKNGKLAALNHAEFFGSDIGHRFILATHYNNWRKIKVSSWVF